MTGYWSLLTLPMLIPYRVKNPVRHFPFATLGLIVTNVIVYACTTEYFLYIREHIVETYAFAPGVSPIINIIPAAFLHSGLFHLAGNMLFLWVFGPPVEDRLGIPRYLLVYFATGFTGDLLQGGLDIAFYGSPQPVIGASGCIMGLVGAYWFLFPWSTVCVFYWVWWFWRGVWEVAAIWIIGLYIVMDFAEGVFFGTAGLSGGVANFAHVGGGVAGILLCMLMRAKRDTEAMSDAKAVQSDYRNLENMPLYALEIMLQEEPGNPELIRAAINPALRQGRQQVIDSAMAQAGPALIDKDPLLVAYYLMDLQGDAAPYRSIHLLRLAGLLERLGRPDWAVNTYRLIAETRPKDPESETALYRCALCSWNVYKDAQGARTYLNELAERFPHGEMIQFAGGLWKQMGQ